MDERHRLSTALGEYVHRHAATLVRNSAPKADWRKAGEKPVATVVRTDRQIVETIVEVNGRTYQAPRRPT
ncbi:MAG: hypothetical protein WAR76_06395, partial [Xanthobacteraceae bacterium]